MSGKKQTREEFIGEIMEGAGFFVQKPIASTTSGLISYRVTRLEL